MMGEILTPNQNYQNYRQVLSSLNKFKPFVPIIAVILKDLTVFEENKTLFDKTIINWHKLNSLAQQFEIIRVAIASFSQLPFLPEVQKLINHATRPEISLDELYEISPRIETPYLKGKAHRKKKFF